MKFVCMIMTLLIGCSVYAEDSETPFKLKKFQEDFQRKTKRIQKDYIRDLEKLDRKYSPQYEDITEAFLSDLEALKEDYAKETDLGSALAVDAVIEAVKAGSSSEYDESSDAPISLQKLQKAFGEKRDKIQESYDSEGAGLNEEYAPKYEKISKEYLTDLKNLKTEYTQDVDLKSALAVDAVIKEVQVMESPFSQDIINSLLEEDISAKTSNPFLGVWEYEHNGAIFSREFTADHKCFLRKRGALQWEWDYEIIDSETAKVNYGRRTAIHKLLPSGKMDVGGQFIATKKRTR